MSVINKIKFWDFFVDNTVKIQNNIVKHPTLVLSRYILKFRIALLVFV